MKHVRVLFFLVTLLGASISAFANSGTITIATFNMENFGYGKSYCKASQIGALTDLLSQYDLVALQEVMRLSSSGRRCYDCSGILCQLDQLERSLESATGNEWSCIHLAPMHRGSRYEYLVLVFRDTVQFLGDVGSACDLGLTSPSQKYSVGVFYDNSPVYAAFRSGNFDFIIINVHSPSSNGTSVYNASLGAAFDAVQDTDCHEQDVIMVGDFNDPSPSFDCSTHLDRIPDFNYGYDAIYIDPQFTGEGHEFCGAAGSREVNRTLSDHPLVWAAFTTTLPDDDW